MALRSKSGKKGNLVSYSYSTFIVLVVCMALTCKPKKRNLTGNAVEFCNQKKGDQIS